MSTYLTAKQVEAKLQETRKEREFTGKVEKEAIQLFLDQTARRPMSPADTYKAGVKAGRADCLALKEIAHRYHIVIRGDEEAEKNPIGVLTSVSDGIVMARKNPILLNKIFEVITDLNWSAGKYSSKAYSAKTIRALKALYSKYESSETLMAEALLSTAKGSEYFANHLALLCQDKLFDTLDELVSSKLNKTSVKAEQMILNI